ncbi:DUF4062 domain-containing protein [Sphingobacterium siyangense]|uniref:DUF4062 domain-containing protein n=1 Tax=Sphingobacterium siyangense TaxID=459529 RepID=UPI003DA47898
MSVNKRNGIKIFVASTVYNFQLDLDRIYELLDNLGYDVMMSHKGTLPLDSSLTNLDICVGSVEQCDVFLGLIRPDYGSGVLEKDGLSITHQEFRKAFDRKIPRFVLADYRVVFTRALFKDSYIVDNFTKKPIHFENISFENSKVMDTRCLVLYEEAIQNRVKPFSKRIGNWVQEYKDINDITLHLQSQFEYPQRIKELIKKANIIEKGEESIVEESKKDKK